MFVDLNLLLKSNILYMMFMMFFNIFMNIMDIVFVLLSSSNSVKVK